MRLQFHAALGPFHCWSLAVLLPLCPSCAGHWLAHMLSVGPFHGFSCFLASPLATGAAFTQMCRALFHCHATAPNPSRLQNCPGHNVQPNQFSTVSLPFISLYVRLNCLTASCMYNVLHLLPALPTNISPSRSASLLAALPTGLQAPSGWPSKPPPERLWNDPAQQLHCFHQTFSWQAQYAPAPPAAVAVMCITNHLITRAGNVSVTSQLPTWTLVSN